LRPVSFHASAELLAEGGRWNDSLQRLNGGATCYPKGVRRFKTHEESNRFDLECKVRRIVQVSFGRGL